MAKNTIPGYGKSAFHGFSPHVGLVFNCDGKELCPRGSTQPPLEEPPSTESREKELRKSFINSLEFTRFPALCQRDSYINLYAIKTYAVCVCYSVAMFNESNLTMERSINVSWLAYLGTKILLIYLWLKLKAKEVDADFKKIIFSAELITQPLFTIPYIWP